MRITLAWIVLLLAGCGRAEAPEPPLPGRWYTASAIAAGEPLYQANCAACHADDGSATEDWRTLDANGNFPPPPLDGTAHTWHHPLEVLTDTIANGGAQFGGVMPGFGALLDAEQQLAIVAYIQSWWSDEIYQRWAEIDGRDD